eukprot:457172-Pyramimonas_sp.AAC.1
MKELKAMAPQHGDVAGEKKTTKVIAKEIDRFRLATTGTCQLAAVVCSNDSYKWQAGAPMEMQRPWAERFVHANTLLRSVSETAKWEMEMIEGGIYDVMSKSFEVLDGGRRVLHNIGFGVELVPCGPDRIN